MSNLSTIPYSPADLSLIFVSKMHFSSLIAVSAFATGALSASYVLHEKRSVLPGGWIRGERLERHQFLPVSIALKQSNLDRLDEFLSDVAHPESENYGQHWSAKQVAETFAPSDETVNTIHDWLESAGISRERVEKTQSLGWLNFDATVQEIEELLKTKYFHYTHQSGATQAGCTEYHLPAHIKEHVDFITPTVHFDAKLGPRSEEDYASIKRRNARPGVGNSLGRPGSGSLPKKGATLDYIHNIITELSECDEFIVPDCLRFLYLIPPVLTNLQSNPYGVVEYSPQAFLQSDLDLFFANYSKKQVHKSPNLISIDGGFAQTTNQSFGFNGESDLDLEYALTLTNPLPVNLYQVGDPYFSGSFNTFLDALDGSYCTFEGGDDPTQDPQYPDDNFTAGYKGPDECGGAAASKVISTSYSYNEIDLTPFYEQRQCSEYAKLGMMGTTFLYSSGDYGVAGNGGQCIDPVTGNLNNGTSGIFAPKFPATCPYITA